MTDSLRPWPLLEMGARRHPVWTLQYLLGAHDLEVPVEGRFDEETDQAVRDFQQSTDLEVDGIVGPCTWSALVVQVEMGSTGDAVRAVQEEFQFRDIAGHAHPWLTVDGIFGPKTDQAVRLAQKQLSQDHPEVVVDGIVGPITWRALVSGMVSG
jgi:peptidoglycan hydrolase-like protein with peptidoglycan-binding domain